jgi:hypothetical protein
MGAVETGTLRHCANEIYHSRKHLLQKPCVAHCVYAEFLRISNSSAICEDGRNVVSLKKLVIIINLGPNSQITERRCNSCEFDLTLRIFPKISPTTFVHFN